MNQHLFQECHLHRTLPTEHDTSMFDRIIPTQTTNSLVSIQEDLKDLTVKSDLNSDLKSMGKADIDTQSLQQVETRERKRYLPPQFSTFTVSRAYLATPP